MSFLDSVKKLFDNFEKEMKGSSREKENDSGKPKEKIALMYIEVKPWLDAISGPILSDIEYHLKATQVSLKQSKSDLEKDTKALEDAKPEEIRDKRLERAILNNRRALASRLANYCHSIKIAEGMKPEDSPEFFESIRENTRQFMMDTAKNFYFVNSGFPEITEDIKETLLIIGKKTDEAIEYLEPQKARIKAIEDSYNLMEKLDADLSKRKEHEHILHDEDKIKKDLDKSKKNTESEIKAIEKSASMKALAGLENEHKSVLSEIASIKDRIINTISPLSRTLKKYGRVAQHLSKDEELLMNLYMEDPVEAIEKDDCLNLLKKIASDLEVRITKGTISVKDKMRDKTVSAISRLKDESELLGLKQNLVALKAKEAGQRLEIESNEAVKKKAALAKKITDITHDIESGAARMQDKKKILETLNQGIMEKISVLETHLGVIGSSEIKISLSSDNHHEDSKK